jgi:hypothetical protein
MGFFDSIGKSFKSIGQKIGKGAEFIGKKSLVGLDYTIQGAKIATDFADKYTLGLDHFIPYYSAIKAGIDISDHVRKMIKGEEKLNLSTGLEIGTDLIFGAMGASSSAKGELEGIKDSYKIFNEARGSGRSLLQSSKGAGSRLLKGYGIHKDDFKEMATGAKKYIKYGKKRKLTSNRKNCSSGKWSRSCWSKSSSRTTKTTSTIAQKPIPRILQKPVKPISQSQKYCSKTATTSINKRTSKFSLYKYWYLSEWSISRLILFKKYF